MSWSAGGFAGAMGTLGVPIVSRTAIMHEKSVSEGVGTGGTPVYVYRNPQSVAETIQAVTQLIYAQGATLTSGIGAHDALTSQIALLLREAVRTVDSGAAAGKYQGLATDTVGVAPTLVASWAMSLTSGVGAHDAITTARGVLVAEALGLLQGQVASAVYRMTAAEQARLATSLGRFFGGDLSDGVGMALTQALLRTTPGTLTDTIGVSDAITPRFLVRAIAEERFALAPAQALAMLFAPDLVEGVQFSGGFLSPSGSFTTWAMNARTGAVTEYQNFAFNSFAKLGHRHIAISASGLYELSGDSDAGTDIIAQIKTGFAQFAGPRFTQIKAIYLAARGGGDYVLKVIAGTGREYHYGVTARDMETIRVRTGKGMQAHYFAFELISTGQDFDLGYLEFVPLVSERRV